MLFLPWEESSIVGGVSGLAPWLGDENDTGCNSRAGPPGPAFHLPVGQTVDEE